MKCAAKSFIIVIIVVAYSLAIKQQNLRFPGLWAPNIGDIKQEYLTQNTVKYVTDRGIQKTDYEINPDRYRLMKSGDEMTSASIYEKDKQPYYPFINPNTPYVTPKVPPTSPQAASRYGISVYPYDQKPYYSSSKDDYRYIVENPEGIVHVPVEIVDLTQTHADESNLKGLEAKLKDIDKGELTLSQLAFSNRYSADPQPYYDPTKEAKELRKQELIQKIEDMKVNLNDPAMPNFAEGKASAKPLRVENFQNINKEETNDFIARTYHYPVITDKDGINKPGERIVKEQKKYGADAVIEGRTALKQEVIKDGTIPGKVPIETKSFYDSEINGRGWVEADTIGDVLGDKFVNEPAKPNTSVSTTSSSPSSSTSNVVQPATPPAPAPAPAPRTTTPTIQSPSANPEPKPSLQPVPSAPSTKAKSAELPKRTELEKSSSTPPPTQATPVKPKTVENPVVTTKKDNKKPIEKKPKKPNRQNEESNKEEDTDEENDEDEQKEYEEEQIDHSDNEEEDIDHTDNDDDEDESNRNTDMKNEADNTDEEEDKEEEDEMIEEEYKNDIAIGP